MYVHVCFSTAMTWWHGGLLSKLSHILLKSEDNQRYKLTLYFLFPLLFTKESKQSHYFLVLVWLLKKKIFFF